MSDTELQLALVKMLPEKIGITDGSPYWIFKGDTCGCKVIETEWLHVCWLVEQTLTENEQPEYQEMLGVQDSHSIYKTRSASWQHRAEALCRVKGIQ